ncbi:MAG: superoxide dismutase [Saprospiraceae bacterium]|nr:superoxide dismutase [Saprospiraceae bacterium]
MKQFILIISLLTVISKSILAQAPYKLPDLGYAYNALEPYIDSTTMYIHLNKHHNAYVNNLNNALKGTNGENLKITELLAEISKYSDAIRNNAGGHYNHSLFWTILTPKKNTAPDKELMEAINTSFTSLDSLRTLMNKAASMRFGSGWAWLYIDQNKKLAVGSSPNQDNPLMDASPIHGTPILGIDVWEHAYYLKYQNRRGDYLSAIWNVINWEEVTRRYHEVIPKAKGKFDDWPEIISFHEVLASTFHPAEEGDFSAIRNRSGELSSKASALATSKIPAQFNKKEVIDVLSKLSSTTKALDKLVHKKSSDKTLMKSLTAVHDSFHQIVERCK